MNNEHPGEDALVAYALDEMEPRERTAIDEHLGGCAECRLLTSHLGAALAAYRTSEPREAPARVLADLLEAQAEVGARRARWWWRPGPVFVTAALVALAGIFASGFWMGRSTAPAPGAPASAVESRQEVAPPARPLPERPAIEFRSEPPLEVRFAVAPETSMAGIQYRRGGPRDSL